MSDEHAEITAAAKTLEDARVKSNETYLDARRKVRASYWKRHRAEIERHHKSEERNEVQYEQAVDRAEKAHDVRLKKANAQFLATRDRFREEAGIA